MATSILQIVLEAVDKATPEITALGAKIENTLVGIADKAKSIFDKGLFGNLSDAASADLGSLTAAFTSVGSAALSVFSTIGSTIKSAFTASIDIAIASVQKLGEALSLGAAYNEAITQSRAIAEGFGFVGLEIEKTIDRITESQLTFAERTRVTTEAVASGLSGAELTDALTFVKRWAEANKQEFTSAADTMFSAFATGRFAALKSQFRLTIEDGANLADVIKAIRTQSALTVETNANFADVQQTVNTVLARSVVLIGSAIDRIPFLQRAFAAIQDGAANFGAAFEDAVPAISGTFEFLIKSAFAVYDAIVDNFSGIRDTIIKVFSAISNSGITTDPFVAIVKGTAAAAHAIGDFAKSVALNFAPVADSIGFIAKVFGDTYSSFKYYGLQFASVLEGLLAKFYTVFGALSDIISAIQRRWAQVWVGLSDTAISSISSISQALSDFIASSPDAANFLGLDSIGGGLSRLQTSLVKARGELKATTQDFTNNFAETATAAQKLSDTLSEAAQRVLTEGTIGDSLANQGDKLREFAKTIDGTSISAATKQIVYEISNLKIKPIELVPLKADPTAAKNAAKAIADERNRILAEADADRLKAQERAEQREVDALNKQQKSLAEAVQPVADLYGKIKPGTNKIELLQKQSGPQQIDVKVSGVNAPAWLQGLLDEIITQLVRAVKSERIPLVLNTYPVA